MNLLLSLVTPNLKYCKQYSETECSCDIRYDMIYCHHFANGNTCKQVDDNFYDGPYDECGYSKADSLFL